MKIRYIALATAALFAIGPVVSHADDGTRLVSITLARIQALLGSGSTAATNLGLGTASLVNTGTSGAVVPLLSGANTYSGVQTIASTGGLDVSENTGAGNAYRCRTDGTACWFQFTNAAVTAQFATFGSTSSNNLTGRDSGNNIIFAFNTGQGMSVPKLAAAPTVAPGAGFAQLFVIPGTTGTCTLGLQAGTSLTVTPIVANVGAGC